MKSDPLEASSLVATLDALRREVAALGDRIVAIERQLPAPGAATRSSAGVHDAEIAPQIVAVISAALAAYLGVKPHIRQISLVGGASWAQQGRVTIQASHTLTIQRD